LPGKYMKYFGVLVIVRPCRLNPSPVRGPRDWRSNSSH
jgi:hypothetical protein